MASSVDGYLDSVATNLPLKAHCSEATLPYRQVSAMSSRPPHFHERPESTANWALETLSLSLDGIAFGRWFADSILD
jgi:hypothetical protein